MRVDLEESEAKRKTFECPDDEMTKMDGGVDGGMIR